MVAAKIHLSHSLDRDAWRSDIAPVFGLAALGLVLVLLVDPRGDFPLNDDWCYAKAVHHLLQDGEIRLTDWGSMSLLTQVLWGAGFSLLLGFNFETLRASTLALGLVAVIATFGLARAFGASRGPAFLAAYVLLANPLFLLLSHTFMTDVPFVAFSTVAILFLVRGFARDSRALLGAGLFCALAATFARQLGLAVLVGFAFAWLSRGRSTPRRWIVALAPLAAAITLLRVYETWLAGRGSLPENYYLQWRLIREGFDAGWLAMLGRWLVTGLEMTIYLGLFCAPIAAVWFLRPLRAARYGRTVVLVTATMTTIFLSLSQRLMPYFQNILLDVDCATARIALGPLTLRDGCTDGAPGLGPLSSLQSCVLTWVGLAGAGALIASWMEGFGHARRSAAGPPVRGQAILLLATAGSYFSLVALLDVFDRYLLFLVPLVLALTLAALPPPSIRLPGLAAGTALATLMLVWSVGALQEYLDWNRARWRAIAYLSEEHGGKVEEIDGGFEFGGWVNFDSRFRSDRRGTSWWWVVEDRYAVAFAELEGWDVLTRFPYRGWFGWVEDDVLALRNTSALP